MRVAVSPACVPRQPMCVWSLWRPEEGLGSPGPELKPQTVVTAAALWVLGTEHHVLWKSSQCAQLLSCLSSPKQNEVEIECLPPDFSFKKSIVNNCMNIQICRCFVFLVLNNYPKERVR